VLSNIDNGYYEYAVLLISMVIMQRSWTAEADAIIIVLFGKSGIW